MSTETLSFWLPSRIAYAKRFGRANPEKALMKKILPYLGLLVIIIILELSWSSFFSSEVRSYFFLFSVLAILVIKKGFLKAFPFILFAAIIFEGITQSVVGPISFYSVLFSYGISFLMKRIHLEHGVERGLLSLVAGIGIALYPVFLYGYEYGSLIFSGEIISFFGFLGNIFFGGAIFLILLHFYDRFQAEPLPLAASFVK